MKKDTNRYLTLGILFGFSCGACIGSIVGIIMSRSNFFIFGIPIGAGLGMLIGIIIGSILDWQQKNNMI